VRPASDGTASGLWPWSVGLAITDSVPDAALEGAGDAGKFGDCEAGGEGVGEESGACCNTDTAGGTVEVALFGVGEEGTTAATVDTLTIVVACTIVVAAFEMAVVTIVLV
jgi:hypothetical protein